MARSMFRTTDFMTSSRNWLNQVLDHTVSPYRRRTPKNTDSAIDSATFLMDDAHIFETRSND